MEEWEHTNPISPQARVMRGPNWKWGDVDGGLGSTGTVLSQRLLGTWWLVKWDK